MSSVVRLRPVERVLTKRQLAVELGRSERWVELRVAEGMPSLPPSKRFSSRRFVLSDVQEWLDGGRPVSRPDRLAGLEREVAALRDLVSELIERVEG